MKITAIVDLRLGYYPSKGHLKRPKGCEVMASFVKEAGIDVNRPEAATAVKKDRANILIAITDKGEIWINKRRIDVRAVQANIERLHAENPQGTVVIQADKKATTDTLIKVMDASRAAGVYDVSIAAQEP